jgi:hypothetical protein
MRIIRSRQNAQGVRFQKQPEGGTGRTRCMKCQGICTTQHLPSGQLVHKCGGCGASYVIKSMGGPKPARLGVVPRRAPVQSARRP